MARILLNSASNENWSCHSIHSKVLFSPTISYYAEIRVNSSIKQQSCLITGAVVGGAIGTPLLFTIFLFVIALVYTIKRNGRKSSNDIIQTNDMRMRMEEISSDLVKGSVENSASPYMYDNEHIYSTVHDEDKMRADDDEYVDMNYSN